MGMIQSFTSPLRPCVMMVTPAACARGSGHRSRARAPSRVGDLIVIVSFLTPARGERGFCAYLPGECAGGLNPAQKNEDNQNYHYQAKAAARVITPFPAVGPGWEGADQQENE